VVLRHADAGSWPKPRATDLQGPPHALLYLKPAHGLTASTGFGMEALVYLAAFRQDWDLDTTVPDQPTSVPMGANRPVKWISNYDHRSRDHSDASSAGRIGTRWRCDPRKIGVDEVITTSQEFGIRTPLQPYIPRRWGFGGAAFRTGGAYRAMAVGILAEPHIIDRVTDAAGAVLYEAFPSTLEVESTGLSLIQEGCAA